MAGYEASREAAIDSRPGVCVFMRDLGPDVGYKPFTAVYTVGNVFKFTSAEGYESVSSSMGTVEQALYTPACKEGTGNFHIAQGWYTVPTASVSASAYCGKLNYELWNDADNIASMGFIASCYNRTSGYNAGDWGYVMSSSSAYDASAPSGKRYQHTYNVSYTATIGFQTAAGSTTPRVYHGPGGDSNYNRVYVSSPASLYVSDNVNGKGVTWFDIPENRINKHRSNGYRVIDFHYTQNGSKCPGLYDNLTYDFRKPIFVKHIYSNTKGLEDAYYICPHMDSAGVVTFEVAGVNYTVGVDDLVMITG